MRLIGTEGAHLTYCTNIHPGESWAEVRQNLGRHVLAVRLAVAPGDPFGIGLRLSGVAASELADPATLDDFQAFLDTHGLYVFTINGFPYGPFHGQPVKEQVYRPDWGEDERLTYTDRLATLLSVLLPDQPDIRGTISTVPIAFAPRVGSPEELAEMSERIVRHVSHLADIRERTGKHLILTLEPEPCCYLETVGETVTFFEEHLFGTAAVESLGNRTGLAPAQCEELLREHLGVCFDACHMAVEFEEPAEALAAFDGAGIPVAKIQISAGLQVDFTGDAERDADLLRRLEAYADPVYLHQVVERSDRGIRRFLDLPEAIREARSDPIAREWRIHFHVPLFREQLGAFRSTQPYLAELIPLLMRRSDSAHWEVETYTWDVLPPEFRTEGVDAAVAREMEWVLEQTRRWTGART